MALKAALNGVRVNFGTGRIRAGVKRADKVYIYYMWNNVYFQLGFSISQVSSG